MKPVLLKEVQLNVTHTIRKSNNEIAFQVTLLDANHCPGAVMFLFQGKFGNILYTGDFRYTPRVLDYPVLSKIIRNKELSVLYLDNTYAAASCKFPSREEALKQVLKIIDENPDCKILIGMRQLGKEEVLRAIALHINEKVCVSSQRLQILSKLEYEDVFTTNTSESRVHAVELHTITQKHSQEPSKVVSIKLTSMYECGSMDKQRGNVYVVPYSDHSSHTELVEFVDQLRPLKLYPIVLPKIPKMTADPGPFYRMSTVNCVLPEEILQLCGPLAADAPVSSSRNSPDINVQPLCIKFHPDPVGNMEKKPAGVYIDEGMNLLPFDSMSSHLTNNNKARKHIKASWTRLAPKILAPKGIKFTGSSPQKISSEDRCTLLKEESVGGCSSHAVGLNTKDVEVLNVPSTKSHAVNDDASVLCEVPLSDDDDFDMPSSARELGLRMQHPGMLNGSAVDKKSDSSPDIIEDSAVKMRRTRSQDKFEIPTRPVTRNMCNDSDSVISDASSVRFTRSRSSVSSVPAAGKPRTRHSLESQVDTSGGKIASRMSTRSSPKESPTATRVSTRSSTSPNVDKNGLSKKSASLDNLSNKPNSRESLTRKTGRNTKEDLPSEGRKDSSGKKLQKVSDGVVKVKIVDLQKDIEEISLIPQRAETLPNKEENDVAPDVNIIPPEKSYDTITSRDLPEKVTDDSNKKPHVNGNISVSNFNGIHINSPGRKRVPLTCDWNAAQEIVKKETEQALKALETLNQMKGFKTRSLGNKTGLVALRRLSADNIPLKSPVKNQSIVVLPVSPPDLRSRTASILSSMATNFSKSSTAKQATSSSALKTSTTKVPETPSLLSTTAQTVTTSAPTASRATATSSASAIGSAPSTSKQTSSSSSTAKQPLIASSSSLVKQLPPSSSATKQSTLTNSSTLSHQSSTTSSSHGFIETATSSSSVSTTKLLRATSSSALKKQATPAIVETLTASSSSAISKQTSSVILAVCRETETSAASKTYVTASSSSPMQLSTVATPVPAEQVVTPGSRPETRNSASLSPKSPVKELSPILSVKENKKTTPRRGKQDNMVVKVDETAVVSLRGRRALGVNVESEREDRNKGTEGSPSGSLCVTPPQTVHQNSDSKGKTKGQLSSPKERVCSGPSEVVLEVAGNNEPGTSSGQYTTFEDSKKSADEHNQGLFLTDETLASSSSSQGSGPKPSKRSVYKRQNDLNLDLIRLKVGFAMTQKGPKRLSLPSRLSSVRRDSPNIPIQSKQKVQDWRKKISVRLRKSPQRRYRFKSPNKLRESAKRTLATILRSGRSLSNSQGYHADVEDCTELSQTTSQRPIEVEENTGYIADISSIDAEQSEKFSQGISMLHQLEKNSQSVVPDSMVLDDSKLAVQLEPRRSSRLVRDEGKDSACLDNPTKSILVSRSQQENNKSANNTKVEVDSLSKKTISGISPIQKISSIDSCPLELSSSRLSDRMTERSRMIFRKSADSSLAPESSNILSFMADAFKNSVPLQTPTTANILSSMAENFKRLDEGAQVSPSLSIQLVSSKSKVMPSKGRDPADWGVQITRIDNSSTKTHDNSHNSSIGGLSISSIPKSLSIEIIPESGVNEPLPRKGPSPPTVTISQEVLDISSDCSPAVRTQSTIHSLPMSPGPRRIVQGGLRWPSVVKSEVQSPPQAVWKEKRHSSQSGDKVIIDIQTQEDPQKVPHCPVHCTCGAASKQGTCMGTMRNLIEADADCLYEVPFSPEDFENSGAMLTLGRGWIESCFEDDQDRDEFMNSYQDLLPTLANSSKQAKAGPNKAHTSNTLVQQHQSDTKQVLSKQNAPVSKQTHFPKLSITTTKKPASAPLTTKKQSKSAPSDIKKPAASASTTAKKPVAATLVVQQTAYVSRSSVQGLHQSANQKDMPKKRSSIEKDTNKSNLLKANSDECTNQQSVGKIVQSRRSSSQSTSSSSSVPKSRSSKISASPVALPPPRPPPKRRTVGADAKKEVKEKERVNLKRKNANTSASSSDSPETKKARCSELERLTDTDKSSVNKRYRLSIRRSLDHLMTRQKLRSDRRVKTSSTNRS